MSKVIPFLILCLGCFLLCLLYVNRGSPRIHEVTGVLAAVIFGALIFAMRGERIEKNIRSVHFVDTAKWAPVMVAGDPGVTHYHLSQSVMFGNYQTKRADGGGEEVRFDVL